MKKLIALVMVASGLLMAQDDRHPQIQLSPSGLWSFCTVNPTFVLFCPNGAPLLTGNEEYMLFVPAFRDDTVAFAYVIIAVYADGSSKVFSGVFKRNDDPDRNVVASNTVVAMGRIQSASIRVVELANTISYGQEVKVTK